ncbi:unnamed protein product [Amoebophrya sp. A120]|nr:unnamed protein product [Amoebophrya sp. A120]|eukprot:GSA120T00023800001.1
MSEHEDEPRSGPSAPGQDHRQERQDLLAPSSASEDPASSTSAAPAPGERQENNAGADNSSLGAPVAGTGTGEQSTSEVTSLQRDENNATASPAGDTSPPFPVHEAQQALEKTGDLLARTKASPAHLAENYAAIMKWHLKRSEENLRGEFNEKYVTKDDWIIFQDELTVIGGEVERHKGALEKQLDLFLSSRKASEKLSKTVQWLLKHFKEVIKRVPDSNVGLMDPYQPSSPPRTTPSASPEDDGEEGNDTTIANPEQLQLEELRAGASGSSLPISSQLVDPVEGHGKNGSDRTDDRKAEKESDEGRSGNNSKKSASNIVASTLAPHDDHPSGAAAPTTKFLPLRDAALEGVDSGVPPAPAEQHDRRPPDRQTGSSTTATTSPDDSLLPAGSPSTGGRTSKSSVSSTGNYPSPRVLSGTTTQGPNGQSAHTSADKEAFSDFANPSTTGVRTTTFPVDHRKDLENLEKARASMKGGLVAAAGTIPEKDMGDGNETGGSTADADHAFYNFVRKEAALFCRPALCTLVLLLLYHLFVVRPPSSCSADSPLPTSARAKFLTSAGNFPNEVLDPLDEQMVLDLQILEALAPLLNRTAALHVMNVNKMSTNATRNGIEGRDQKLAEAVLPLLSQERQELISGFVRQFEFLVNILWKKNIIAPAEIAELETIENFSAELDKAGKAARAFLPLKILLRKKGIITEEEDAAANNALDSGSRAPFKDGWRKQDQNGSSGDVLARGGAASSSTENENSSGTSSTAATSATDEIATRSEKSFESVFDL